jgi:hypothetical protein
MRTRIILLAVAMLIGGFGVAGAADKDSVGQHKDNPTERNVGQHKDNPTQNRVGAHKDNPTERNVGAHKDNPTKSQ